jgi:hypothetical protein
VLECSMNWIVENLKEVSGPELWGSWKRLTLVKEYKHIFINKRNKQMLNGTYCEIMMFLYFQECDQVHIDDVSSDDNGQDLR